MVNGMREADILTVDTSSCGRPEVSVICPVFQDSENLKNLLQSLGNQNFPPGSFEVIVVENSSEDFTLQVPGVPRVKFLKEPQYGSYAARNRGIEASEGKVLAFIDADCIAHPNWLLSGVDALRRSPGSLVAGQIVVFPNSKAPSIVEMHQMTFAFDQGTNLRHRRGLPTANLFIERNTFHGIGLFPMKSFSGGDAEWSRRALAAGAAWVFEPRALVYHPARRSFKEVLAQRRRFASAADNLEHPSEKLAWFIRWTSVRQESITRLARVFRFGLKAGLRLLALHGFLAGYQTVQGLWRLLRGRPSERRGYRRVG